MATAADIHAGTRLRSASLVLLGSQRLQADHLDLAGPLGRSSIRVNVAATAQCLASNKLLRPSPADTIGPMGLDYMLIVHNPVVPAVQDGAFVVVLSSELILHATHEGERTRPRHDETRPSETYSTRQASASLPPWTGTGMHRLTGACRSS